MQRINVDSIIRYFKFLRDHFLLLNDSWEYTIVSQSSSSNIYSDAVIIILDKKKKDAR